MLLQQHADGVTLHDLVKFDIAAKDVILKRQSMKLWKIVNSLTVQMQNAEIWMDANSVQDAKQELRDEFDNKLETEIETINTKMGKQMAAFFQNKITRVDQKLDSVDAQLSKQDARIKTMDTATQVEIAKLKKQVQDLGQGKITSETELN